MIKFISNSSQNTECFGKCLGEKLPYGSVIALFGDLGAGKTAFTRGFVTGIGIDSDVSSPTFALVNEYHSDNKSVYHFDMYRISSWDDLYSTGFFEYLDSGASLVIEWSENIEAVLPDDCIRISINKTENDNERIIEVDGCDNIEITCN